MVLYLSRCKPKSLFVMTVLMVCIAARHSFALVRRGGVAARRPAGAVVRMMAASSVNYRSTSAYGPGGVGNGGSVRRLFGTTLGGLSCSTANRNTESQSRSTSSSSSSGGGGGCSTTAPGEDEDAVAGTSSSSGTSSSGGSSSSTIHRMYPTLTSTFLCGAPAVVVRSPPPERHMFRFTDEDSFKEKLAAGTLRVDPAVSCDTYSIEADDIGSEELVFGRIKERNNKSRLNKFVGGRVALRRALKAIGKGDSPAILKDTHGAPVLPGDVTGSISHKDDLAVGVAIADSTGGLGVDIERCHNKAAFTLLRRIITEREQHTMGRLPGVTVEEEVLLRFSFKEAVYKAMHPFLERSVDFSEVEIEPQPDGSAKVTFLLKSGEQFRYRASWQRYGEQYWLTCVYLLGDVL